MASDLEKCFLLLRGVGTGLQEKIFSAGISDWNSFSSEQGRKALVPGVISIHRWKRYARMLDFAGKKLLEKDSLFFARALPKPEWWRLYDSFREHALFIDIETTGASKNDKINIVGLSRGLDVKTMVRGFNMDGELFGRELSKAKLIVSFNGSSFDIPFLKRTFPSCAERLDELPHLDLRHICSRAGLTGGLKRIEASTGISRMNKLVEKILGGDPILLWRTFLASGDRHYLDLLVEYNHEDTFNMRPLIEHCISVLREKHF